MASTLYLSHIVISVLTYGASKYFLKPITILDSIVSVMYIFELFYELIAGYNLITDDTTIGNVS